MLRLALLQVPSAGADPAANLGLGLEACREAAAGGADLALFPEMWQLGYTPCPDEPEGRRRWQAQAIGTEDPWLGSFRAEARRLGMAIVATYLEAWPGAPRNTAALIDRHGCQVATYAKVHTCDFSMEAALTPGDTFKVATIDTAAGPVRVGMMICFDRELPEAARVLMLEGAELIVTPNACGLDDERMGQFRARAFENMVAMAMANYPEPEHNGRSCAFDGMAYAADGRSRDQKVLEAGAGPGVVFADIDLDALRRYRAREVWGDAYRKPQAYGRLVRSTPKSL